MNISRHFIAISLIFFAATAHAQVFPGAVVTDAQIGVVGNSVQTVLVGSIGTTDTTLTVADCSKIVPNMFLTIDSEIVMETAVSASCVLTVTRPADGTFAFRHYSGALVSNYINAGTPNALRKEIEAVENALGANLSNIPGAHSSSAYIFSAQTPGGNLIVGTNTVSMFPCPAGVNGSDVAHYLYISGGTGTAEAALITGGTCVSGAFSGTVILQAANTHSGAWTVQSATAGMQEAVVSLAGAKGRVNVPAGLSTVYAATRVNGSGVTIVGAGPGATIITDATPTSNVFELVGATNQVYDLAVTGSGSKTAGYVVQMAFCDMCAARNMYLTNVYGGFDVEFDIATYISQIRIAGAIGDDVFINGGNDQFIDGFVSDRSSVTGAGVHIRSNGGTWVTNSDFIRHSYGMLLDPGAGDTVTYIFANQVSADSGTVGFAILPNSTGAVTGFFCENCWASSNSLYGVYLGNNAGLTNTNDVRFSNSRFYVNGQHGVYALRTKNVAIEDSSFSGNGASASNTYNDIMVPEAITNFSFRGNHFNSAPFTNTEAYNIVISAGADDYYNITGNIFNAGGLSGTLSDAGTGIHANVKDNLGYNPVGQAVVTVGASPFTYRAGHSPETVYIAGGTVSSVKIGTTQVATASPTTLSLPPNGAITVTYSAAPTMVKDVQ